MSVTIRDVAKVADVSPSTVSRVISDSPQISHQTKVRVRRVMDDMGYYMNYTARNLAVRSTRTIGIVMKNSTEATLHDAFFPEVIRGISALCSEHDFNISLTTGETDEAIYDDVVKMVQGKRVDGLIVLYSKDNDRVVPYLVEMNIPFVIIGHPLLLEADIMSVDNDNVQAGYEATSHLIHLGHEHIAFISGDPTYEVVRARREGFTQAMEAYHLVVNDDYLRHLEFDLKQGDQLVEELMALKEPPTALVLTNDLNALLFLTVLSNNDLHVPEDISVISFNNSAIAQLSTPALTSVDINIHQLGYTAAKQLLKRIKQPEAPKERIIIPTRIKERQSCRMMTQNDKEAHS